MCDYCAPIEVTWNEGSEMTLDISSLSFGYRRDTNHAMTLIRIFCFLIPLALRYQIFE
jgi:hypothetical protein